MRILFLTPQLPYPPRQGTQIRNYHLVQAAAGTHDVDLLSFVRPEEDMGSAPRREGACPLPPVDVAANGLLSLCRRVETVPAPCRSRWSRLRSLITSVEPDLAHRLASQGFAAALTSLLQIERYDVVQVEGLEMSRYIPIIRALAPQASILFDDHNVEHLLQTRAAAVDSHRLSGWPRAAYSLVQSQKLRRYEARACQASDAVLVVSEADARALRDLRTGVSIHVVPNCVDVQYYQRDPMATPQPASLLFTGTMDYRPNVDAVAWFATDVLPLILALRPDVRVRIVGRSPSAIVKRLAEKHPNLQVIGAVEDVRPYFSESTLFVVPIRMAGGARLKILESMAMGLPVVSTPMGAEGIELADGRECLLAAGADSFATSVLQLLEDPALRTRLALAGRQIVEERYDWNRVAPRLLGVYAGLARDTGAHKDETSVT